MMKRLALLVGLVLLSLVGTTITSQAYYLDTPHNESNGIYCYTCHEMPDMVLSAAEWAARTAANPDDTMKNAVCNACHDADSTNPLKGPAKMLHASSTTSTAKGTWTTECTQCHDVHSQGQLDWSIVDSGKLYLVTGEFMTANGARTYTDLAHSSTGYDYTTIGFNPVFTTVQPGWSDTSTWKAKGGNMDPARALDGSRGLILVPDKTSHVETFEIVNVVGNVLTVKGNMVKDAVNGGSFGIFYGQSLKSSVMPNGGSSVADYRDVKFFIPKLATGTYGGFVDLTTGTTKPLGLCQVCHVSTSFWNSNGTNNTNHNPGTDCDSCHDIKIGGKGVGGHAATDFVWNGNCADCHSGASIVTNVHNGTCTLCHDTSGSNGYTVRKAGDATFGIDGTAVGGTITSGCTDCHNTQTPGQIHHDSKNGLAAVSCATSCHATTDHKGNHSSAIQTYNNCASCHLPAAIVGGTAATVGAPVDPLNNL
ncbi:MAG: hypothetical protein HGA96_12745, partial [Desulfobulbaceae bacterium]|nr:hypothetical protein [Desulfobulbaceae bacterium]